VPAFLATVLGDRKQVMMVEFMQQGITITSEVYCETLKDCGGAFIVSWLVSLSLDTKLSQLPFVGFPNVNNMAKYSHYVSLDTVEVF
jgi:hypothetical protein